MKKIYIIIPTYNGIEETRECLKTIVKLKEKDTIVKTIIVDNASSDKTPEKLELEKEKFGIEKIIKNNENRGFAKACNQGIEYAREKNADYVFLLNSDMEIIENSLPSLIQADKDIISPVNQFPITPKKDDYRYDYGGYINWWTGRVHHDDRTVFSKELKTPLTVEYDSGCSLLIKKEVFEKIGLFDERFFMYFEDVDFCVRAKNAGLSVAVDPSTRMFHKLGSSVKRWSKKAIYYNISSNVKFILKHCGYKIPVALGYVTLLTAKIIFDKIMYKLSTSK